MNYSIDSEREDDGRWLAEVSGLPGELAYGATQEQACARSRGLTINSPSNLKTGHFHLSNKHLAQYECALEAPELIAV